MSKQILILRILYYLEYARVNQYKLSITDWVAIRICCWTSLGMTESLPGGLQAEGNSGLSFSISSSESWAILWASNDVDSTQDPMSSDSNSDSNPEALWPMLLSKRLHFAEKGWTLCLSFTDSNFDPQSGQKFRDFSTYFKLCKERDEIR